ncbi:MAG: flagellar hook-associated protein FlgK [Pararhizobium sp.]
MSLSSAINAAQTMLSNTATQTALVSKNISNSGNADYNQRSATLVTTANGSRVAGISRAQNIALLKQLLSGTSASSAQDTLLKGLETLKSVMGGNNYESAPSTLIAALRDALQTYAVTPGDATAAQSAVNAAKDVANGLNNATTAVQQVRTDADSQIAQGVSDLNSLLQQFEGANNAVVQGTRTGTDISDALDKRDALLKQISGYVGITTVQRADNDTVIYTNDGTTLFETIPRTVSFTPTTAFDATTPGNGVYIDGVALPAGDGANTTASGKLQALLQLRDDVAPTFQSQLDEIARGLVSNFAESDQATPPNLSAGLFTWTGGLVPAGGTIVPGLAGSIMVNPAADQTQGGDPLKLRDGDISGVPSPNTEGGAGYSDVLNKYLNGLNAPVNFDMSAGAGTSISLFDYASASVGWLEQYRSTASTAAENKDALTSRSQDALSNATGVNIDEEMSRLLDLEQSYKASAKMITTVDAMLSALFDAVH